MHRLSLFILTIVFSLFLTAGVFAAEIKIDSAQLLSTGKVNVVCTLTDGAAAQEVSVISYETGTDLSSISSVTEGILKKMIHIDQFDADVSDGKFEFEFEPAAWMDTEKTYVVKVGGTNITQPDLMIIKYNEQGEITLIYGDADGDGEITASDSAFILQRALVSTFKLPVQSKTKNWFEYADADNDGEITASDSAYVLQKVLVRTFKLPAEK